MAVPRGEQPGLRMPDATSSCGPNDRLNERCFCISLDRVALAKSLDARLRTVGASDVVDATKKQFFADVPVFVRRADIETMQRVVTAIGRVSQLPLYVHAVLEWAPSIARFAPGPIGAFMGFDFHLTTDGPRLIEVNTNAGGAFVNAELARAQRACCNEAELAVRSAKDLAAFDGGVIRMFESEWSRQRGGGHLSSVAIVDDAPEQQFMYPEFRLAQNLLEAHGIEAMIADPSELSLVGRELRARGKRLDLVYNRLVDFAFDAPEHEVLRTGYLDGLVVVTPNPRVHALFADKRNLTLLGDADRLRSLGAAEEDIRVLELAVPRCQFVTQANAESLWRLRRDLFFKPAAGYGSKGVYRGSSVTRGKFASILEDGYIAQQYVPPSERLVKIDGENIAQKVDVRLYTYNGCTLLSAARIYRGQATNLRTPGGGFAPVFQT
jgi:glutathione synthase/RimK-type ligase-like ATP-grasp enzyme